MIKKNYCISLNTISLVKEFVNLTGRLVGNVSITSGRYIINGKSIMGIFSLDLMQDLNCEIESTKEEIQIFEEGLRNLKLI